MSAARGNPDGYGKRRQTEEKDKADAQRNAGKKEAEANSARAAAKTAEERQRARQ